MYIYHPSTPKRDLIKEGQCEPGQQIPMNIPEMLKHSADFYTALLFWFQSILCLADIKNVRHNADHCWRINPLIQRGDQF